MTDDKDNKEENSIAIGDFTRTRLKVVGDSNLNVAFESNSFSNEDKQTIGKVDEMSDFSRNELQAHLKASKSEIEAIASSMKADMATWNKNMAAELGEIKELLRTQQAYHEKQVLNQHLSITADFAKQNSLIEKNFATQQLKTISDVKLDIIKWVLGLPALAFTLWKIYEALSR